MANFGHPVIWGGDESSGPEENTVKHVAFKGMSARLSGVDLYLRHHGMSNPLGRSAHFTLMKCTRVIVLAMCHSGRAYSGTVILSSEVSA